MTGTRRKKLIMTGKKPLQQKNSRNVKKEWTSFNQSACWYSALLCVGKLHEQGIFVVVCSPKVSRHHQTKGALKYFGAYAFNFL